MSLTKRDKAIIWHPFTQEQTAAPVLPIKSGKGSYLYDEKGKAYLDLISSWWVNIHGHSNRVIAEAIYQQAQSLEHVIFAGFTHEPAITLCEALKEILPANLTRFFFSDNGSTAVEVALKLAYQYWRNQGQKQKRSFLSFEGGYHGDTFGAMAVGLKSGFHDCFEDLCFHNYYIPFPATWEDDTNLEEKEQKSLEILLNYLELHAETIAGLIVEPLVQGAAGMRMCRPEFIQKLIEHAKRHKVLIIFDEIMTGFYRTGSYFALDQCQVEPDFLCLSKALTGGFLPLALTVTTEAIFNGFLGDSFEKAFAHGHSYTANPLACAAGIASLNLLKENATKNAIQTISQTHQKGLNFLKLRCPRVEQLRLCGTIAAFQLKNFTKADAELKNLLLEKGFIIRPLGANFYLLPPYTTTQQELENAYDCLAELLKSP